MENIFMFNIFKKKRKKIQGDSISYEERIDNHNPVQRALLGFAIGDALGVPYEFRANRNGHLCVDFDDPNEEYRGCWSDDTSMVLATMDALCKYSPSDTQNDWLMESMHNYVNWLKNGEYTSTGKAFGIGGTTARSLKRFTKNIPIDQTGDKDFRFNGNGALMRLFPLAFYDSISDRSIESFVKLTHAHEFNIVCCKYYVMLLQYYIDIMRGKENVRNLKMISQDREIISSINENEIPRTGFVYHSLLSAMYCLFTTSSYKEAVLKCVNMGGDTDTNAAICGAVAGIKYGFNEENGIPLDWVKQIANPELLFDLSDSFADAVVQTQIGN